jgi:hypothetical protein
MILGQGLRTIFIGVAIGITGSLDLTRVVESMLFGVTATDPLTFGGVTLLVVGAALLASYVPARRAAKVAQWLRCGTSSGRINSQGSICKKVRSVACLTQTHGGNSPPRRTMLSLCCLAQRALGWIQTSVKQV